MSSCTNSSGSGGAGLALPVNRDASSTLAIRSSSCGGVREHDGRALAAELQRHVGEAVLTASRADVPADLGRAGE